MIWFKNHTKFLKLILEMFVHTLLLKISFWTHFKWAIWNIFPNISFFETFRLKYNLRGLFLATINHKTVNLHFVEKISFNSKQLFVQKPMLIKYTISALNEKRRSLFTFKWILGWKNHIILVDFDVIKFLIYLPFDFSFLLSMFYLSSYHQV